MNRRKIKVEHEEVLTLARLNALRSRYQSMLCSAVQMKHPLAAELRQNLYFTSQAWNMFTAELCEKYPGLTFEGMYEFDMTNNYVEIQEVEGNA